MQNAGYTGDNQRPQALEISTVGLVSLRKAHVQATWGPLMVHIDARLCCCPDNNFFVRRAP